MGLFSLQKEKTALQGKVSAAESKISTLESAMQQLEKDVSSVRSSLKAKEKDYFDLERLKEKELAELKAHMEWESKSALDKMLDEHMTETQELQV